MDGCSSKGLQAERSKTSRERRLLCLQHLHEPLAFLAELCSGAPMELQQRPQALRGLINHRAWQSLAPAVPDIDQCVENLLRDQGAFPGGSIARFGSGGPRGNTRCAHRNHHKPFPVASYDPRGRRVKKASLQDLQQRMPARQERKTPQETSIREERGARGRPRYVPARFQDKAECRVVQRGYQRLQLPAQDI